MKKLTFCFLLSITLCVSAKENRSRFYITNQAPLVAQPYTALPLGTIHPRGMLLKMLQLQRDGLTGHLDSIYSLVCGNNNGWLGGTGDGWERGPYWIDGLVPLAYILNDEKLKAKAQQWIEWSIKTQREDGYFGPQPLADGYKQIPGTQQDMRDDWWPKMVMLKVMQQYYMATQDQRIITLMTRYFKYQLATLPQKKLGAITFWAEQRGGDNLQVVYWLYNITKAPFLLDLGKLIHQQTFNWTEVLSGNTLRTVNPYPELHCVNVAQGIKEPIIYYQQSPEQKYLDAVKKGLSALRDCHGFVNGMYGGDERLHGNNPTQGSELCSAVELMYSFESMLPITGDVYYADYLEKIAYNVLPTQHNDDFTRKQYFQQVNQVQVTNERQNYFNDDNGRSIYGTTSGFPCCVTNMHQGWPKLVQNLWYATADNGLAALVYGASEVTAKVATGDKVTILEETGYPFKEKINFTIKSEKNVAFPFHLRIPVWCKAPVISINGKIQACKIDKNILILNRNWVNNDVVSLELPMEIKTSNWFENSVGIERGPLVYALKIKEQWQEIKKSGYDDTYWEVIAESPWNYALLQASLKNKNLDVQVKDRVESMPWNLANAPITIKTKGRRLDNWQLENNSAGIIPVNPYSSFPSEDIELIPYGCSTLRIAEFPVAQ